MKLGVETMWGDSLDDFRAEVKLADSLGYDILGIGDSPAAWRDLYVSMSIAAMETQNVRISPFVTGPFLRHPLTVANGFSALQDVSNNRMVLGLATGGSNVIAVGRKPASLKQMNAYWDCLESLFSGGAGDWEGRPMARLHNPRKTPLFYSAFGPKSLALAGRRADGVILFTDGDLEATAAKIRQVHSAAVAAGRKPSDIEIWVTAFCSIRATRAQALDDIKAFLVTNALTILYSPDRLELVSPEMKQKLLKMQAMYDVEEHCVVGGNNVKAMESLGDDFVEYLAKVHTVAGTPEYVRSYIDDLETIGVSAFITNLPGHADKLGHLKALADLVNQGE